MQENAREYGSKLNSPLFQRGSAFDRFCSLVLTGRPVHVEPVGRFLNQKRESFTNEFHITLEAR